MKRALLVGIIFISGFFMFNFVATTQAANVLKPACNDPSSEVQNSSLCKDNAEVQRPKSNKIYGKDGILTKVVNMMSVVIGFAAVVMVVLGGIKYIMSSGESNAINSAKNTILYAIIGLAVAGVSQALIAFVLNRL